MTARELCIKIVFIFMLFTSTTYAESDIRLVTFGEEPEISILLEEDYGITFYASGNKPVLVLTPTGEFIINGRKTVNDLEIYKAFVAFLNQQEFCYEPGLKNRGIVS